MFLFSTFEQTLTPHKDEHTLSRSKSTDDLMTDPHFYEIRDNAHSRDLQNQLNELRQKLAATETKNSENEAKIEKLKQQKAMQKKESKAKDKEKKQNNETIAQNNSTIAALIKDLETKTSDFDRVAQERDKLKTNNNAKAEEILNLKKDLEAKTIEHQEVAKQLQAIQQKKKAENAKLLAEVEDLKKTINKKTDEWNHELKLAKKAIEETYKETIANLKSKLQSTQDDLENIRKEFNQLVETTTRGNKALSTLKEVRKTITSFSSDEPMSIGDFFQGIATSSTHQSNDLGIETIKEHYQSVIATKNAIIASLNSDKETLQKVLTAIEQHLPIATQNQIKQNKCHKKHKQIAEGLLSQLNLATELVKLRKTLEVRDNTLKKCFEELKIHSSENQKLKGQFKGLQDKHDILVYTFVGILSQYLDQSIDNAELSIDVDCIKVTYPLADGTQEIIRLNHKNIGEVTVIKENDEPHTIISKE